MYRIGCDVGGTNTDAAVLDLSQLEDVSRGVLATHKTSTTPNVTDGIKTAVDAVLQKSQIPRSGVINVAIGTTHFVNAVVESDARQLQRVAVIRLCGPYTRKNPPFSDYPYALRDIVEGPVYYLDGGFEVDGREIAPLNEDQIRQAVRDIFKRGIRSVAVVGIFSALDTDGRHEKRCRDILIQDCPGLSVVCSADIGGPGFLVRENATILNAAIVAFARRTIRRFHQAMKELDLSCPLYLTQNDGTLISATNATELPIKTFASGPTNSLMGAAFLQNMKTGPMTGNQQILVVDIGGTTTDICALLPSGFPRKAPNFVEVGGVRTAFSMPEVKSVGFGGGSRVRELNDGKVSVGPDSVAYRLTSDAIVFGGDQLTATDIAVASRITSIGNLSLADKIPVSLVSTAKSEMKKIVERAIDTMRVSTAPVKVILVGGGSIIVDNDLEGVVECLRPPHFASANAVGAAIASVAGEVDTVAVLAGQDEEAVLEQIKLQAISAAIGQGADKDSVYIAEIDKIPLQYVTDKTTRFVVKAVGPLDPSNRPGSHTEETDSDSQNSTEDQHSSTVASLQSTPRAGSMATPVLNVDLSTYRPDVRDKKWYISPVDVDLIAIGCGILGTGGGGSSYDMALFVYDLLNQGGQGKIRVIAPESLQDSDICVFGAGYGAPSVSNERLSSGDEVFVAVEEVNKVCGISDFAAIVADEIGGGNGLVTFPTSAHFDRPIVDCDLMGRAYPTAEHITPCIYGYPVIPCSMADSAGNVSVVTKAANNAMVEKMLRIQCTVLGNSAAMAAQPLSGAVIKQYAVPNTVSQAWFLGRAVHLARKIKIDILDAIAEVMPVKLLYTGKIIDVKRDLSRGYTMGECIIAPLADSEQEESIKVQNETRNIVIPFQNEYLAAYLQADSGEERDVVCIVPDLISILGQDGEALGSPDLRYGLQVKVIGMPAHPLWTGSDQGLKIGGPEFFGLDMKWQSIGKYQKPSSVFEVYGD